jgi:PPK2 family polyphosphate:nucleotide phosphotransferase
MNPYKVNPWQKVNLHKIDPEDEGEWKNKKDEGQAHLVELRGKLDKLQELLYAEHSHKVLVVFQALDTAGKDGTTRAVFEGVNPQGVHVANFKAPSQEELDHDYLWRAHAQMPGKGELVIFNRSHYEDVLVVRVHNLVASNVWSGRYDQINNFEHMLAQEGTTIIKFFLHISPEEQAKRLLDRIETPEKQWKFNSLDLQERLLWKNYIDAYNDVVNLTSSDWAPWYVIPANHNWLRNMLVAEILVETLENLDMKYPAPAENLDQYRQILKKEKEKM